MRIYRFIRDNGGWDKLDMILIEQCKCENRLYALRKEREYIEQFEATLNKQIPTQSSAEYMRKHYALSEKNTRTQTRMGKAGQTTKENNGCRGYGKERRTT